MTSWLALFSILTVAAPAAPSDTIFRVDQGETLRVENLEGEVHVGAWDRDEVEVISASRRRRAFRVGRRGSVHMVRPAADSKGHEYRIRIPRWMEMEIRGHELEVTVEGLGAGVSVFAAEGDVHVRDVLGSVSVTSVDGEVLIENVRGPVTVETSDDDIRLQGVEGNSVLAQSVDGDVVLLGVTSLEVVGQTVDGDVEFDGSLVPGGTYRLSTHDGDMTVWLQEDADAAIEIATFDGELHSDFPLTLQRFGGDRHLSFRLGSGSSEIMIEAFDGGIYLRKREPGAPR